MNTVHEWKSYAPIIGGIALMAGSGLTIYVDRYERLQDASSPRPVYYRYFSQAILALHQWPHWLFCLTTSIFAPCLYLTSKWQAIFLENECDLYENHNEECISLGHSIQRSALLCGIASFLDAWTPLGRPTSTVILHNIWATGFFSLGAHYVYSTIKLASLMKASQLIINLRVICFVVMVISGIGIVASMFPAINATGRLFEHQYRGTKESKMEAEDITKARRREAFLSTFQMALGIGLGLDMFTAFPEILKVINTSDSDISFGRQADFIFGIMLSLTAIQYYFREPIYQWCQSKLLRFRHLKTN